MKMISFPFSRAEEEGSHESKTQLMSAEKGSGIRNQENGRRGEADPRKKKDNQIKMYLRRGYKNKRARKITGAISHFAYLKEYMVENPPNFEISSYCCVGAKKRPCDHATKKYKVVLKITGERRAENGLRAVLYTSCFSPAADDKIAAYRPIFFFSDSDKHRYEKTHRIISSDCYTVYGSPRTGCVVCPLGSGFEDELKVIEQHEPKPFLAAVWPAVAAFGFFKFR